MRPLGSRKRVNLQAECGDRLRDGIVKSTKWAGKTKPRIFVVASRVAATIATCLISETQKRLASGLVTSRSQLSAFF